MSVCRTPLAALLGLAVLTLAPACQGPAAFKRNPFGAMKRIGREVIIAGWHDDGVERRVAVLWRNGVEESLPDPPGFEGDPTMARGLTMAEGDLYVVGNVLHADQVLGVVWKNGSPTVITEGEEPTVNESSSKNLSL